MPYLQTWNINVLPDVHTKSHCRCRGSFLRIEVMDPQIFYLRMRCICRFHHPAILVPPMSLLCTGGPGRRGRRGLDPAESCDISWAWGHGPWPSIFVWTWELQILDHFFRTAFINQPCLGPMALTRCSCMCGLFDSFRSWVFQDLGGQWWTNDDETDGTTLVVPWKSSDVFFSKMHEWWTLIGKEEDDLAEDPIVDLADPHFDVEVRRWWFQPFCWKECDEDLDIFKLLECRTELDTFLVLYLHFRGVDHPKSSEFNCFVVSLCGGLWKQMSYFTKTYSISLVVESLTMGPEHPNSPWQIHHLLWAETQLKHHAS